MPFDPSTATPVEQGFDPESAQPIPVHEQAKLDASEHLAKYEAGDPAITQHDADMLHTVSRLSDEYTKAFSAESTADENQPWWLRTAKAAIGGARKLGASLVTGDAQKGASTWLDKTFGQPRVATDEEYTSRLGDITEPVKAAGEAAQGVATTIGSLPAQAAQLAAGAAELSPMQQLQETAEYLSGGRGPALRQAASNRAIADMIQHATSTGANDISRITGISNDTAAAHVGQLVGYAAIPFGELGSAEAAASAVKNATSLFGNAAGGAKYAAAKLAPTAVGAAKAATVDVMLRKMGLSNGLDELMSFWAGFGGRSGVGNKDIANKVVQWARGKSLQEIADDGAMMASKPMGTTANEARAAALNQTGDNLGREADGLWNDLNTSDKLKATAKNPDGSYTYDIDSLSKDAQTVRQKMLDKQDLVDRANAFLTRNKLQKVWDDVIVQGAGNVLLHTAQGATVGAGFTAASAPTGQTDEAVAQGITLGGILGLVGSPMAFYSGERAIKARQGRDALIARAQAADNVKGNLDGLTDKQKNYVYTMAGQADALGRKSIHVLTPDDLRTAGGLEASADPGFGFVHPETGDIYLNKEALPTGVAGHELTHVTQEFLGKMTRQAAPELTKDFDARYQAALDKTGQKTFDSQAEQDAERGRLVLNHTPIEMFYGGEAAKTGVDVIKDIFDGLSGKKGYQFYGGFRVPISGADVAEMKQRFYQAGEIAARPDRVAPFEREAPPPVPPEQWTPEQKARANELVSQGVPTEQAMRQVQDEARRTQFMPAVRDMWDAMPEQNREDLANNRGLSIGASTKNFHELPPEDQQKVASWFPQSKYMPAVSDLGFYSKLEQQAEDKLPNKVSGQQALATLNAAGVKPEEMKWVMADIDPSKTYTKQELLDHIRANNVQVQEVVRGGRSPDLPSNTTLNDWAYEKYGVAYNELNNLQQERIQRQAAIPTTKYSMHVLPGGEPGSYREVLLTLPSSPSDTTGWTAKSGPGDLASGPVWEVRNAQGKWILGVPTETAKTAEEAIRYVASKDSERARLPGFRSGHFAEPNVLAHVRYDDRIDPQGNKVLMVQELQSDWAQKARREGIRPADLDRRIQDLNKQYKDIVGVDIATRAPKDIWQAMSVEDISKAADIRDEWSNLKDQKSGVPSAPFIGKTEAWTGLALKRMLRKAAEEGYDKLAWTTGEQQAERYDMSKQVKEVMASKNDDGTFYVRVRTPDDLWHGVAGNAKPEELPNIVGKDLAEKIASQGANSESYEGLDLKVGGEGMKGYYNKIVPSVANTIGRKFGAKVGTIEIPTIHPDALSAISLGRTTILNNEGLPTRGYRWNDADGNFIGPQFRTDKEAFAWRSGEGTTQPVHSIDITPQMKESVMQGQPLFMPSVNEISKAADDYNKSMGRPSVLAAARNKPKNAADIADAFDLMQHAPDSPAVQASYDSFKKEIKREWDYATKKLGITIEPTDGDPYGFTEGGTPPNQQLFNDVLTNKHISVFRGGNELLPGHPLAEVDPDTGENYNTMFRAVHDIFGHVAGEHPFTEAGEESAWARHKQMFPPDAVPAMTTETRGQTSWFFNNKSVLSGQEPGAFAEQKAGLLPRFAQDYMPATVNIGLKVGDTGSITPEEAIGALKRAGVRVETHSVKQSNTEPTLVAFLNRPLTPTEAHKVSEDLQQGSIAQYSNGRGELYGPDAATWRPFNPEYFLTLSGEKLSDVPPTRTGASGIWDGIVTKGGQPLHDAANQFGADPSKYFTSQKPDVQARITDYFKGTGQAQYMPSWVPEAAKKYITADEEHILENTQNALNRFKKIWDDAPKVKTGVEWASLGKAQRNWYDDAADKINEIFGPDADRFSALLASTSANTAVEPNMEIALHVWDKWVNDGRPIDKDGVMTALGEGIENAMANLRQQGKTALARHSGATTYFNNVFRSLSAEDASPSSLKLSGPKVGSFFPNLTSNADFLREVTNDRHIAKYITQDFSKGVDSKIYGSRRRPNEAGQMIAGKTPEYIATSAHIRQVADRLTKITGETWTPRQTQAAIWSYVLFKEGRGAGKESIGVEKSPAFTERLSEYQRNIHEPF